MSPLLKSIFIIFFVITLPVVQAQDVETKESVTYQIPPEPIDPKYPPPELKEPPGTIPAADLPKEPIDTISSQELIPYTLIMPRETISPTTVVPYTSVTPYRGIPYYPVEERESYPTQEKESYSAQPRMHYPATERQHFPAQERETYPALPRHE